MQNYTISGVVKQNKLLKGAWSELWSSKIQKITCQMFQYLEKRAESENMKKQVSITHFKCRI